MSGQGNNNIPNSVSTNADASGPSTPAPRFVFAPSKGARPALVPGMGPAAAGHAWPRPMGASGAPQPRPAWPRPMGAPAGSPGTPAGSPGTPAGSPGTPQPRPAWPRPTGAPGGAPGGSPGATQQKTAWPRPFGSPAGAQPRPTWPRPARAAATGAPTWPRPAPVAAPTRAPAPVAAPIALSNSETEIEPMLLEKYNEKTFRMLEKKEAPKRGRDTVKVTTSMVQLNWNNSQPFSIYKYDLKIRVLVGGVEKRSNLNKEEMLIVMKNLQTDSKCMEVFNNIFWSDMRALFYSRVHVTQTTFQVTLDERRQVELIVTPTETITMTDMSQDADERFVQAFSNAILFETTVDKKLITSGSKIFFGRTFDLDRNLLEGRMGINYNFRNTEKGMMLAVDQAASAFLVAGPLLNAMKSICGRNFDEHTGVVGARSLTDLSKFFFGVKVLTKHGGYQHQYTIKKFSRLDSLSYKFMVKDADSEKETEMTVKDYFKKTYNIDLRYPKAPLMETSRKTFVPIELLFVKPDQRYNALLSPYQTSQMILAASAPPADVKRTIMDYVQSDKTKFRLLSSFDIDISSKLEEVDGYLLTPPVLQCGQSKNLKPFNGQWRHNDRFEVHSAAIWLDDRNNCDNCTRTFFRELSNIVNLPNSQDMPIISPPLNRVEVELKNMLAVAQKKGFKFDIFFFFIGGNDPQEYKEIKRITDLVLNVPSQCIVVSKMLKMIQKGYASNIAQKINAKLGGKNCICSSSITNMADVMVCGADVTHPMPGEKSVSVSSVVGTFDKDFTQYAGEARVQGRGKEIITEMVSMMEGLFNTYYRKNNKVPQSVVFYRDGVGDQMFDIILRDEIPKIYIAFHRCFPTYPYELKLTFLICQKRHTVKFFPEKKGADKNGNAQPGLVVDTKIVSKTNTEFYLQSQASIKGTGRSCRYTTLIDDNNMDMGSLEKFTFALCHLFNRCMRSIGICSPARYAHHLCFRARDIMRISDGDDSKSSSSFGSHGSKVSTDLALESFDFDSSMKDRMFYV